VFDKAGNLYGATTGGGTNCAPIGGECGLVFELSPPAKQGDPWTESIVFTFKGEDENDASAPTGGLIIDGAGNLYGVTAYGGTGDCVLLGVKAGCGTVYELSPPATQGDPWTETLLYSFKSGKDGYFPWGTLTFDSKGNLYGATQFGGGKGNTCNEFYGGNCGTVFELSPAKSPKDGQWTETVLHSFAGGTDGANPNGGLVLDGKGAIYGAAYSGANQGCKYQGEVGCGAIFALTPPKRNGGVWAEKQIYVFKAGSDGANPNGGIIFDARGSLYGTAEGGPNQGQGIAFRMTKAHSGAWKETLLYVFADNGEYGDDPLAGLTFDAAGNLYGTTYSALSVSGTAFRLQNPKTKGKPWTLSLLHGFQGAPDGAQPAAGLISDGIGNYYGTTSKGGTGTCSFYGCGTVFEVSP